MKCLLITTTSNYSRYDVVKYLFSMLVYSAEKLIWDRSNLGGFPTFLKGYDILRGGGGGG